MFEPTKEQIAQWKQAHGDIFQLTDEDQEFSCVLKTPPRTVLGMASQAATKNPLKFGEVILTNCWLAGDEKIKTDNALFMGVSAQIGEMIKIKDFTLKKL